MPTRARGTEPLADDGPRDVEVLEGVVAFAVLDGGVDGGVVGGDDGEVDGGVVEAGAGVVVVAAADDVVGVAGGTSDARPGRLHADNAAPIDKVSAAAATVRRVIPLRDSSVIQ